MPTDESIVFVVDDDAGVRQAIQNLLSSVGLRVEAFGSALEFLNKQRIDAPGCLVLDVRLPGLSGLDFQRELAARADDIPIVFITGHGDIPMSVEAMKAGAVEFLTKPVRGHDLLSAVHKAIERDRALRERRKDLAQLRARLATLTPRENQVMELVVTGLLNKQIAAKLGTSERTVKIHRAQVMRKMESGSLPDLVRTAERLGIPSPKH